MRHSSEGQDSMDHPSSSLRASPRISRTLVLALAAIIAMNLMIAGISLILAFRINRINYAVDEENAHILIVDQIHDAFDDIIFKLQQMIATGSFEGAESVHTLQQDLNGRLDTFRGSHSGDENSLEGRQELALLSELDGLAADLRGLGERIVVAGPAHRLGSGDMERLSFISSQVPRKAEEYTGTHRLRVARLIQNSQGMIQMMIWLYVGFLVLGCALVVGASIALTRGITAPLRILAHAAQAIAEGHLERRVPVRSANEIGQLSQAFNVMADRLQGRERDLQSALDRLEQKVRETQALYRIGTEISSLHELDRILHSVVEKARQLLRSEATVLCLLNPAQDAMVVRAQSGPPEQFQPTDHPVMCRGVRGNSGTFDRPCPILGPDNLRAHLSAPLRRGETVIGAICVSGREAREFTAADDELLAGLATQASIAIENSRLYDEVRSLAALEERERIAREMHDGLAQVLGLLHLKLEDTHERALKAGDADASRDLQAMIGITERAYEEVRQSIFGLRTMVSRGLGLIPTLTEYLHEFSVQTGIAVELESPDDRLLRLPPASEVQLIRIVQEALTNVRKHAGADRAAVRLYPDGPWVRVIIEDHGRGFDPRTLTVAGHLQFGLQGMRERAEGLGGKVEIDTAPGRGTRVVATLPGER